MPPKMVYTKSIYQISKITSRAHYRTWTYHSRHSGNLTPGLKLRRLRLLHEPPRLPPQHAKFVPHCRVSCLGLRSCLHRPVSRGSIRASASPRTFESPLERPASQEGKLPLGQRASCFRTWQAPVASTVAAPGSNRIIHAIDPHRCSYSFSSPHCEQASPFEDVESGDPGSSVEYSSPPAGLS